MSSNTYLHERYGFLSVDNAAGTLTDISGQAQMFALNPSRSTIETPLVNQVTPDVDYGVDKYDIDGTILITDGAAEAYQQLYEWWEAKDERSFQLWAPDKAVGSDTITGECILADLKPLMSADATKEGPKKVTFKLKVSGNVTFAVVT